MMANGNDPLREPLLRREIAVPTGNYNDVLSEMIEDVRQRDIERLEIIRAIPDMRIRAISACVLVGINQRDIASLMHQHQSTISRLYRIVSP